MTYQCLPGQISHDLAQPDDSEGFLETSDGRNWLYDCGHSLLRGDAIRISINTTVSRDAILEEVSDLVKERHDAGEPGIEELLCHALTGSDSEARRLACEFLGCSVDDARLQKTPLHEIAEAALAPHAEEYAAWMAED